MSTLDVIKALADETRLRIVGVLEQTDSLCACEIESLLGINQSNASRHLGRLRAAGVVNGDDEPRPAGRVPVEEELLSVP